MLNRIRTRLAPQPLEYGSVCFAMLLDCFGIYISMFEAARLCGVTQDGCTMKQIADAAARLNFQAEIRSVDCSCLIQEKRPCIVTLEGKYAVFTGFAGNKAVLYTPDRGRVTMTSDLFESVLEESALFLIPPKGDYKSVKKKSPLAFAFSLITKENLGQTLLYSILLVGVSVFLLLVTELAGAITNLFFSGNFSLSQDMSDSAASTGSGLSMVVELAIVFLLLLAIEIWIVPVFAQFSAGVSTRCRRSFMWSALNLPIDLYQIRSDGYFMESANEALGIGFFLSKRIVEVMIRPLFALFYLYFMFRVSVPCCLMVLASVGVMVAATLISAGYENKKGRIVFYEQSRESGFLLEGLKVIRSIRNSGSEYVFFRDYVRLNRDASKPLMKYDRAQKIFENIPLSISNISKLAIILTGAYSVYQSTMTFGNLVFIHGLYCVVADYMRSAVLSGQMLLSMKYRLENLGEICDEAEKTAEERPAGSVSDEENREEYAKLKGHIQIERVSFSYSREAGLVINDISIDIPAGSSVAIVGATGCGKTTLKKLISGRYEPREGKIFFDGIPQNDVPGPVLANSIASVDQQIILFEDTVMNNIKMWDNTQLDADAILASRDAQIHEDIILREGGYKSLLTEDGDNYSGGQRQRMEIARALSMDPSILLLDEATSALDTIMEKRIVDFVRKRGITTVVIAHRLSTIKNCDCIYVMDQGRIVGNGTHEELMESCELYRRLVTVE